MDQNDKQFFEQLAGAASGAEETYDVELAKTSSGAVAARAKNAEEKQIDYDEETAMGVTDDGTPEGSLIVDVYQTPDEIVVQSAIAGVRPEDIDISATPDKITIRGTRHHEKEVREDNYLCQECYWGRFAREIIFPQEVDPEGATVSFKNGILTVRLPKTSKKKTKKLHVKSE
jgi:HSP20 family protein